MIFLPQPLHITEQDGFFPLSFTTRLVLPPDPSPVLRTAADQLCQEALRFAGFAPEILCGASREGDIALERASALSDQAYTLTVRPDGILLRASGDPGLLYAVQTLRQLIRQSGSLLPCCAVEDAPAYPARGFYHDVTRGRVPTLESLKRLADTACFFKLNQLQLYIEHTYLFRDLSEVWRVTRPLTAGEIMELDAYCADRGIELVPSLASFGHLFELLSSKSWHHLSELESAGEMPTTLYNRMAHHTLNVSDPRAFELIASMIDEFMPLFSSRKFNLCADETFDLGKGRGRKTMEEVGEKAYYIGFVRQLCDHIISRGRQPMFWGDIIARFPEAIRDLPENVLCLTWNYSAEATEDVTRAMAEAGAVQYVCPGVCGWNEWFNLLSASYSNIARMADYGRKYGAVGFLNTDWGDFGHINDPAFSMPGLIYGAVMSWQRENPPMDALNAAISRLFYLDPAGKVLDLLARIPSCTVFPWHAMVLYRDQRLGVLDRDFEAPAPSEEDVARASEALAQISRDLREAARAMDTSARGMLSLWLTALTAVDLCNQAGCLVLSGRKDPALASRLEYWFRQYESTWRATCHESELWRVRDVIFWYADQLR